MRRGGSKRCRSPTTGPYIIITLCMTIWSLSPPKEWIFSAKCENVHRHPSPLAFCSAIEMGNHGAAWPIGHRAGVITLDPLHREPLIGLAVVPGGAVRGASAELLRTQVAEYREPIIDRHHHLASSHIGGAVRAGGW